MRPELRDFLNFCPVHEVEFFIWPIHHESHILCIAKTEDRNVFLFDPFSQKNLNFDSIVPNCIRDSLETIRRSNDETNGI